MTRSADFWSRRKARVAEEEQAQARAIEAEEAAAYEAEQAEKSDEDLLEELGLPDPDSLQPGDDFKAFMAKAVPDRIRRRALRKLWLSNPALANLDGLLDYGEDFTDSAKVIENMQTAYQVGKGMLAHVEELARQAAEAENPVEVETAEMPAPAETAEAATPEADEAPVPDESNHSDTHEIAAQPADRAVQFSDDTSDYDVAPRRRMRFAFDDQQGAQT